MECALIETIFFEEEIYEHPTTARIRRALPKASWVPIDRYQELFNKRHQNFKLQIGHKSQIDVVQWQGAPKIHKNIDKHR